jgi:hypothetical protein
MRFEALGGRFLSLLPLWEKGRDEGMPAAAGRKSLGSTAPPPDQPLTPTLSHKGRGEFSSALPKM